MSEKISQQPKITIERMRLAAKAKSKAELARMIGVKPQSINTAITRGKIPDRWFDVMEEKYGVSREELTAPPKQVRGTLEQNYHVQGGTREEDVIAALRAFKVLEWLADEADNYSIAEAIGQITALADYQAWLKKRKGKDTEIAPQENISDGTHGK